MRCLKRYEKAVKKATSEQKELLTQGIEPNPGPVYREDSIEFADVVGPVVAFANAHHRTILIAILRDGLLTVFDPEEIAGVPCLGARIAAMPMRREGNVCVVITRQPYASLVSGDCVCCVHACAFDTSDAADLLLWIRQRLVGIEPNPGPEDYPYAMYLGFREEGRLYELFADDSFNTLTRVQRASLLVVPILLNSITPSNDISTIREHEMSFVLNGRLMCVGFRDRLDLATFLFQLLMTQGVEPNPGPVSFNDWADSHKHTKVLVLSPDASALLAKQTDDVWTIGENEFKRLATDQKPCPFAEFRLDVNMIPMLSANPAKPTERLCPCKQKVVFLERRNAKCTRHLFHCPPPEYFFDERKNEDVDVLTGKWDLDESIAALWRLNRMAMKKKPELVEEYKKKCEEQSKIRPRTVCYCQQHPDGMFVFPTVPSLAKAESAPAAPAVPTAASTDPLDPPPKGNLDAIAASLLPQDWARVPNMFKAQVPSLLPTEPAAKSATNAPTSCCRATKKETHGVLTGCVPEFEELERMFPQHFVMGASLVDQDEAKDSGVFKPLSADPSLYLHAVKTGYQEDARAAYLRVFPKVQGHALCMRLTVTLKPRPALIAARAAKVALGTTCAGYAASGLSYLLRKTGQSGVLSSACALVGHMKGIATGIATTAVAYHELSVEHEVRWLFCPALLATLLVELASTAIGLRGQPTLLLTEVLRTARVHVTALNIPAEDYVTVVRDTADLAVRIMSLSDFRACPDHCATTLKGLLSSW
jgi:hypothetical protein